MEGRAAPSRSARLKRWTRTALVPLVDLLAPDRCHACAGAIERDPERPPGRPVGLCAGCLAGVAPAGAFCLDCPGGERRRRCRRHGHLRLTAAVQYGEATAALVRATKYERNPALLHAWEEIWAVAGPREESGRRGPSLLIPVPLHPTRVRERGFDLPEAWCRRLSARERTPSAPALRRSRPTPPQVGRDRRRRNENLRGAFAPGPAVSLVAGRTVALVDDVVTTGATAREAARVLAAHGARTVEVWAWAWEPLE